MAKIVENIEWDFDSGEEELVSTLPSSVQINFPIDDDAIADALSDAYFFCVKSFTVREV